MPLSTRSALPVAYVAVASTDCAASDAEPVGRAVVVGEADSVVGAPELVLVFADQTRASPEAQWADVVVDGVVVVVAAAAAAVARRSARSGTGPWTGRQGWDTRTVAAARVPQEHSGEWRAEHSSPRVVGGGLGRRHCAVAVVGSAAGTSQRIAKDATWPRKLDARLKATRADGEMVDEEEADRAGDRCAESPWLWHALQTVAGAYREGNLTQS